MNHFTYQGGQLHCEGVPLARIAEAVGTPTYVYSSATLTRHFRVFDEALAPVAHQIHYSVKACSNIAILRLLHNLGAGFDVVSAGEIYRLLAAGIPTDKVVFSGVGKTTAEMRFGLEHGIHAFNVESEAELETLSTVAQGLGLRAPVSLRVNPEVDAQTHPYIATGLRESKFGIPWERALATHARAAELPGVRIVGLDCHIGSQISSLAPFLETVDRMLELAARLRADGHAIEDLDLGGGLGITYNAETPPHPDEFAAAVVARTAGSGLRLLFEPGRVIVGNAAVMLMRVLHRKSSSARQFVIVDAAMNDAIRPALYGAFHAIDPVSEPGQADVSEVVDVVGPICETGDFFARQRALPFAAKAGDLLALRSAGAYGFAMASNYNSRPRAAEVLVDGDDFDVIRQRETFADLVRGESVPTRLKTSTNSTT